MHISDAVSPGPPRQMRDACLPGPGKATAGACAGAGGITGLPPNAMACGRAREHLELSRLAVRSEDKLGSRLKLCWWLQ